MVSVRRAPRPAGLSERVRDLVGLSEALQVELVRGLAGWDRLAAWAEDGAVTPVTWLKNNTPLTETEASGLLRVARLHAQHPSVAAGLDGGDLTVAKARFLWRAEKNREAEFAQAVDGFVELAWDLSAADFAQVLGRWVELVDDQAPPEDSKRRFTSSDTYGGSAHSDLFGPSPGPPTTDVDPDRLRHPTPVLPRPPLSPSADPRRPGTLTSTARRPAAPAIGPARRPVRPRRSCRRRHAASLRSVAWVRRPVRPRERWSPTWRPVPAIGVAGASAG